MKQGTLAGAPHTACGTNVLCKALHRPRFSALGRHTSPAPIEQHASLTAEGALNCDRSFAAFFPGTQQPHSFVFLLVAGQHASQAAEAALKRERRIVVLKILKLRAPEDGEHGCAGHEEPDRGDKEGQRPRPCLVQNPAAGDDAYDAGNCSTRVGDPQQDGGVPRGQICVIAVESRQRKRRQPLRRGYQPCTSHAASVRQGKCIMINVLATAFSSRYQILRDMQSRVRRPTPRFVCH